MSDQPPVVLVARSQTIADLVEECANGSLPFSGPDSLCSKVAAMGYKTTSLYEMVMAAERTKYDIVTRCKTNADHPQKSREKSRLFPFIFGPRAGRYR